MSKYADVIQKAREPENQVTRKPESQKAGLPAQKGEEVNLSIKVLKKRRQHWSAEAKRQGTTITAVVIEALGAKFGEPQE